MFINSVSPTSFTSKPASKAIVVNGKKLVPLSKWEKPILKLTAEEEQKISSLRERIAEIALKRMNLEKYYGNNAVTIDRRDCYDNAFMKLDWECDMLLNQIEEIQKNRYAIQMAQSN